MDFPSQNSEYQVVKPLKQKAREALTQRKAKLAAKITDARLESDRVGEKLKDLKQKTGELQKKLEALKKKRKSTSPGSEARSQLEVKIAQKQGELDAHKSKAEHVKATKALAEKALTALREKKKTIKQQLESGLMVTGNKRYNEYPPCSGVYVIKHKPREIKIGHSENISRRMHEHKGYRTNNTLPNLVLILKSEAHATLEQEMHKMADEFGLTRNGKYEHFCGSEEDVNGFIALMKQVATQKQLQTVVFAERHQPESGSESTDESRE